MGLLDRRPKPPELRIQLLNPAGTTPDDEIFIELLAKYPPRTSLQTGDICELVRLPRDLHGEGPYPNIWEVRAVYSRWQQALHGIVHRNPGMFDWAVAQLEAVESMRQFRHPSYWRDAVVYAHAFPHGQWPSSAEWFPEWCLKKLPFVAPTLPWEPILDEFSTPFHGYDPARFGAGVVLDLAPDIYGDQRNRKRPLNFEEDAFHKVCLFGLEEDCMVPTVVDAGAAPMYGWEHDY